MTNFYRLTKKELSFVSFIEKPFISRCTSKRLSVPVALVFDLSGVLVYVWTLRTFRSVVKNSSSLLDCRYVEIRALY